MKKKVMMYNILTTIFALLTLVSVGGVAYGVSVSNVIINTALCMLLTSICYKNENKLRKLIKNKVIRARKRKLIYLENYKVNKEIAKRAI